MNDHKDVALVLDMRSAKIFNEQNLEKSVNFALEKFKEDTFINWKAKTKQLEMDSTLLKNKYQKHGFSKRRRHWVFIIGAHSSSNVDKIVLEMGKFTDK